jgi:hypothetical protein
VNGGPGGARGASGTTGSPAPSPRRGLGGAAGAYISGFPLATFPATGTRLGPAS